MTTPNIRYKYFEGSTDNALHIAVWSQGALCLGLDKMTDGSIRYGKTLIYTKPDSTKLYIKPGFYIVRKESGYEVCNPTEFTRKYGSIAKEQDEKLFAFLQKFSCAFIEPL